MPTVHRRDFIRIASVSAGAAAVATGLPTNWWGAYASESPDPKTDGDKVVPTFCEICFWKCGVLAHVKDGRVTKIVGNPDHPLSKGRLCPRGTGGAGLLYDPDRLKKPMIRVKGRGEDHFEEVSWEKALDETAEQLLRIREKHGPEALALFTHGYGGKWFTHLMKAYGSPNIGAPSYAQCRGPREVGYSLTFGSGVGSPENLDIENARCLVLIGSHLGENMHNTQVQEMATAIGRGAELVVVDPRFSTAAGKARYWLPIKPGTDMALLLAWMNVMIAENRFDADYVAKYAVGFDELKTHVADKTPEWAYPITGLRPELIRESGRFLASFRPATLIHPGRRTTWYGDDTQRGRAMAILAALLGSWGRRGGYVSHGSNELPAYPYTKYAYHPKGLADKPSANTYPLADEVLASGLCDATFTGKAPYEIKGWLVYGSNLMQCLPNPKQTEEAIQKLDFIAAIDVLPTEIVGWADVVLPESTYLERCDELVVDAYKGQPYIAVRQPAVEPMYDSKPGWWIAREIAHRIGLSDYFPWKDSMEYAMHRLHEAGYDCNVLRDTGVILGDRQPTCEEEGLAPSFDTPSGKIELRSQALADMGFEAIPDFHPHEEPPSGMFRLLFGRAPSHTFGRTTNNRFLGTVFDQNEVWVNADVARSLPGFGSPLKNGDLVVLENQDGVRSTPIRAKVTERIRGDCVYMVHGWGHTAKGLNWSRGRGASDSALVTRYKVDPIMGGTGMNVNFVRIAPAEA